MLGFKARFLLSTVALGIIGASAFSGGAAAFTDGEKEEINALVRQYILDNPEIIPEAMMKYELEKQDIAKKKKAEAIAENKKALTAKDLPYLGNPKGDVTVVEFFDYNCGYCKHAVSNLMKLVEDDKNIRVVFHELPILGPSSKVAAQWAMAAHRQGKYFEYHRALMEHRGGKDEATLKRIGKRLGLDTDKLKKDAESDAVKKDLLKSANLASEIGISGTPAFIVGDQFYGGLVSNDAILEAAAELRAKK